MALKEIVEQTVAGLGYELVEIQRSAAGLLRVTIDVAWDAPIEGLQADAGTEPSITVEDCEKVTRQLLFALEVDGVDFKRLEVSSPGIDRLLRNERDFERFAGHVVDLTLKAPVGATGGQVSASRKKFRGVLTRRSGAEAGAGAGHGWQITWSDEPVAKPGQKISKKRPPAPLQVMEFSFDELREARLAPIVSFKGRSADGGV